MPVIPPRRPQIKDEPFSTFIVLNRSELPPAERFFLYPIHVSISFLMTKGLNSALYLMLLRFLHRDYDEVFRLADSVATDTQLNAEGLTIFNAFTTVLDDWHPDAHAGRLKISLVTLDSGMSQPWDLTIECSRYITKLDCVSSCCRLALSEELQLLDSSSVATSNNHLAYRKDAHVEYSMALCFNRQQQLQALVKGVGGEVAEGVGEGEVGYRTAVACRAPARILTSNWPYYQDNTVFGETYMQLRDVGHADTGDHCWTKEVDYPHTHTDRMTQSCFSISYCA